MSKANAWWQVAGQGDPFPYDFVLWNSDRQLQAYDFDGSTITPVGDPAGALTIATANRGSVAALGIDTVAVGGSDAFGVRELGKYRFNGTTFELVGNIFTLPNSIASVAGLGPNRAAVTFVNAGLRTYDFDGTDWAQTGNANSSLDGDNICAISATQVTFTDGDAGDQLISEFDGTDWSTAQKRTATVPTLGMTALTATRIALYDAVSRILYAYDEGVANYAQVGNGLNIPADFITCMCALSESRIILGSNAAGTLQAYDFDGTDWAPAGSSLAASIPQYNNLANGSYLLI